MYKVFIGIGSNRGNRFENLKNAIDEISTYKKINLISKSSIYETEPMYYKNQNHFLNMVLEIVTDINPDELLRLFKDLEIKLGRKFNEKNNYPRKIDIDILDFNKFILNSEVLTLPHPKIRERLFVLKPWNDISPDYFIADSDKSINELMLLLDSNDKIVKFYINKI